MRPFRLFHCDCRTNVSDSIGISLYDEGRASSRRNLSKTDDAALSRRIPRRGTPSVNTDRATDDRSRTDASGTLPKDQAMLLPQTHRDQQKSQPEPEPQAGALDAPRMDDVRTS